mmetsp:Transcript_31068/g.68974  ORF Transcript_31068/g.68974 Transcript_31068/m.68974 type:complete len:203 (+) Transcript_31068:257-865(+)|eukprot:CAMPEP_0202890302 /NCGR_PEP_ID=MMETSP1392-20130828/762_1 /ASSEMBLY_ACC=CAM_ASM_000868 /TAXON_ID=225041 /ORGANISM="Chlamydomonas chlamydogama, Strain SAG 11-48b" /LENGTH=202 /DNA_ID=CAMNT_0049573849 /DNA_START=257 /DNA_END=865 /DNA_ORIENTATION=-
MPPKKANLQQFTHHGLTFKLGEACLINPDSESSPPFIGKIREIVQRGTTEADIEIKVTWFYRPEEAVGGRKAFHGLKELFDSDHQDWCHKNTILGKCRVHSLKKYENLSKIEQEDFFSRFTYKPAKKEFDPDRVPVYCSCELPYNPDRPMVMCDACEEWYHPDCIGLPATYVKAEKERFVCSECKRLNGGNVPNKRPALGGR